LNWVNSKQVIGTVWGDFGVGTTIYVPYQYIWCIPCLKHRIYSVNTRFWPTCKPLYASYHTSYILPYTYTYCRIHTAVYIITYRASNAYHVHPRMHHTIHSIICMPCTPSYASYHTQHHMHAMYTIVCIIPYTASYACHVHHRMHHTIHSIICMPCTLYTIVCIIPYRKKGKLRRQQNTP